MLRGSCGCTYSVPVSRAYLGKYAPAIILSPVAELSGLLEWSPSGAFLPVKGRCPQDTSPLACDSCVLLFYCLACLHRFKAHPIILFALGGLELRTLKATCSRSVYIYEQEMVTLFSLCSTASSGIFVLHPHWCFVVFLFSTFSRSIHANLITDKMSNQVLVV
ncbi:hypothetical protein VTN96DRAFT_2758 [Rasamsonia emersonii]